MKKSTWLLLIAVLSCTKSNDLQRSQNASQSSNTTLTDADIYMSQIDAAAALVTTTTITDSSKFNALLWDALNTMDAHQTTYDLTDDETIDYFSNQDYTGCKWSAGIKFGVSSMACGVVGASSVGILAGPCAALAIAGLVNDLRNCMLEERKRLEEVKYEVPDPEPESGYLKITKPGSLPLTKTKTPL